MPYLLWRLDSRTHIQARLGGGKEPGRLPSEMIRSNIVVTTTGVCAHPALICALSALGEDSVLFSVDYPYEDCSVAAEFIETAPISEGVRAMSRRRRETSTPLRGFERRDAARSGEGWGARIG